MYNFFHHLTFFCIPLYFICFLFLLGSRNDGVLEAFIVAHGRQQSSFEIADTSKKQSALLITLFSRRLQMIISVHVRELVFRDSENGILLKTIDEIGELLSIDITAAVLDDRERKIITGDSSGIISIYNIATGVLLKSFLPISTAVQFVMYSPDKTIIVIGSIGDIYIYDDRDVIITEDFLLR